ncbi:MAG: hypothetical protein EAZ98_24180 [Oscillatoriales cyanobacterium]|uniref:Uncharacterized protein n=1 Tax=Microcoleus anatoxicus PTRS2 TaxID=2705321 RepID=A0ABU8YQQ6_9CYAN|nr:MAG: hypothetical protein EAZ98_24180 [Oscillatoriales cyanobacterium]
MAALNRSTLRRLQNLPQIPSVWEGDRRPLSNADSHTIVDDDDFLEGGGECILWVDGSEGVVRAMDMVGPDAGPEAIVRALLRAMEHPQSPSPAVRPQKIVVKNREIQFYLRGVLQDLGIAIDYVPELPLIDEIFRGMEEVAVNRPPELPPEYADVLMEKAAQIWHDAPWQTLREHQIISIEVNQWDVASLYVSVLGQGRMDYGVLLYRSLESLKRFRERVVNDDSFEDLEQAFLGQDCLFLTFESAMELDEDEEEIDLADLPPSEIEPNFGNLHPLEGLRSILYEEEALTMLVALEAFHRFFRNSRRKLAAETFPTLSSRYRIPVPLADGETQQVSVKVSTMPEVSEELWQMLEDDDDDDDEFEMPPLRDDLVPPNSFLSLGVVPWATVDFLRGNAQFYQGAEVDINPSGDGLPVVMIQTSHPKAKTMIQDLKEAEGVKAICFNPGEDPFQDEQYDLGILQAKNGDLYLFGEFNEDDPVHQAARQKWERRCQSTQGWCGLVIAKGLMGASRGQPQLKDMIALFEVRWVSAKDLGIGPLQLMPTF